MVDEEEHAHAYLQLRVFCIASSAELLIQRYKRKARRTVSGERGFEIMLVRLILYSYLKSTGSEAIVVASAAAAAIQTICLA
jgi:hypothetical protein